MKFYNELQEYIYRFFFARINLIDVGSAGNLPSPWAENTRKIRHLLAFEPLERQRHKSFVIRLDTALWKEEGMHNLFICKGKGGSGSSLYQQNVEYVQKNFETLSTRGREDLANTWFERSKLERIDQVFCKTLDGVLAQLGRSTHYHFLKIDAQGAEYEILSGAKNLLSQSCVGLHLELFVLPLYKGIHLLPDVVEYLEQYNFKLVKKYPAHGSFDSQHECVFLKIGIDNKVVDVIRKIYNI